MNTFTKIRIKLALVLALMAGIAFAQEEEEGSKLTISGSVDAYYRINLNTTPDPIDEGATVAPGYIFCKPAWISLWVSQTLLLHTTARKQVS